MFETFLFYQRFVGREFCKKEIGTDKKSPTF